MVRKHMFTTTVLKYSTIIRAPRQRGISSLRIKSIARQQLLAGTAHGRSGSHLFLVGTLEAFVNQHLLTHVDGIHVLQWSHFTGSICRQELPLFDQPVYPDAVSAVVYGWHGLVNCPIPLRDKFDVVVGLGSSSISAVSVAICHRRRPTRSLTRPIRWSFLES